MDPLERPFILSVTLRMHDMDFFPFFAEFVGGSQTHFRGANTHLLCWSVKTLRLLTH